MAQNDEVAKTQDATNAHQCDESVRQRTDSRVHEVGSVNETEARMLVLTRKEEETVTIGEVVVTILRINSGSVKVGIKAPKSMPIHRDNIKEKRHVADE